ncbi:hypothetical protein PV327_007414 [Microctonus hyperodae]|uniref:THAP-type domain-containing protein n=1 Tax=Microctonus hyperodae TaxID=165561 RepID=A0AA39FZD1_MICHY|nr:hypothetical protein PV327_007414 [Microctonus hyperodae]
MESEKVCNIKQKARIVCCVPGCNSRSHKNTNVTFHYFPRAAKYFISTPNHFGEYEKIDLLVALKKSVRVKNVNRSMKVCSLHFKVDDYILPSVPTKKKFLKKNAVPTCNLPCEDNIVAQARERRLMERNAKKDDATHT